MSKQEILKMVSAVRGGEPVCRPARLKGIGQMSKRDLAYCPFPKGTQDELCAAFEAAPQFAGINVGKVLPKTKQHARVILISENGYDARQAALYLAAMSSQIDRDESDELFLDDGLDSPELNEELEKMLGIDESEREITRALLVTSASLLDPGIASGDEDDSPMAAMMAGQKKLDVSSLSAPALLVYADIGPALSETVVEQLEIACGKGCDVFLALRKSQIDLKLVNELILKHHFIVVNVQPTTDEYLVNVLRAAVNEQRLILGSDVNCATAVSAMRRLCGMSFNELDLYDLAAYAAQHAENNVATAADLVYHPYSPKRDGRSAMDELGAMTGLDGIKSVLRYQIAVTMLKARHGGETACRSLAFAGSPGTGKSVTARLVAEILQENGCGTGRFVEAGREQLIGKYVGHTSPKIAKLFEEARGGVLFIDEAGALIPNRSDSYAEEAVNALVRHMELAPETMVIFATYSQEMQELLDSNPGLSSRIAQVLEFPDYTDEQLWEILGTLTAKEDFALPADAHDACCDFFRTLRARRGRNFGNGREARRLRDAAIAELALRVMDDKTANPKLTAEDFSAAAKRLLESESKDEKETARIGF